MCMCIYIPLFCLFFFLLLLLLQISSVTVQHMMLNIKINYLRNGMTLGHNVVCHVAVHTYLLSLRTLVNYNYINLLEG